LKHWNTLESTSQVDDIINKESHTTTCVILKHSTTCSISSVAKMRLDRGWQDLGDSVKWYYLDLLSYRPLSKYIAETLDVHHESPQVIIVRNGEATYDVSHLDISIKDLSTEVGVQS